MDFAISAFVCSIPVILLTILSVGLYNERLRSDDVGVTTRIFVAISLSYLLVKVLYQITILQELPAHFTELYFFGIFLSLSLSRFLLSKIPYQQWGLKRILVLGAGKRASLIEQNMRRKTDRVGIDIVGFVRMEGDQPDQLKKESTITIDQPLEYYVINNKIDEVVIACDERRNVLPNESLFSCRRIGVKVIDIIDFFERETGQIAINHLYPSWLIYGSNNIHSPLHTGISWLFNTTIALIIFALTWPFMLLTILAIKLEEDFSAPVLYSQKRTGLNGALFDIYKFRSMRTDAEKDGAKWAEKSDPRVTKVGSFIRKYRIDELPQLFNVIKGDMGFVGPRPERPEFTDIFQNEIPYYSHRFNVKPGLTGWAQLKYPYGSSEKDTVEKLKFDLYYIKNRGILFDLHILLRTAEIVLFGKGR